MSLRSVKIDMGVGEVKLDLRGQPKRSYDVSLHGGVGEATIYLPKDVGIEADAKGGIGGINASGLRKQDGRYVNDAWDTAKTKIHLDVRGGVGQINMIAE
jgi:predicted membrane protein